MISTHYHTVTAMNLHIRIVSLIGITSFQVNSSLPVYDPSFLPSSTHDRQVLTKKGGKVYPQDRYQSNCAHKHSQNACFVLKAELLHTVVCPFHYCRYWPINHTLHIGLPFKCSETTNSNQISDTLWQGIYITVSYAEHVSVMLKPVSVNDAGSTSGAEK